MFYMLFVLLTLGFSINPHKKSLTTRFSKKSSNSYGCDLCIEVVNYIELLLENQTSESEIAVLVEQLCATFPSPYDSLCKFSVSSYLPLVIQLLAEGIKTSDICKRISLCSVPRLNRARKQIINNIKVADACSFCTQAMDLISTLLSNQTSEDQIKTALKTQCKNLPSPYDSVCVSVVETSLTSIIQLVEQGLDSTTICSLLSFCSTKKPLKNKPPHFRLHKRSNPIIGVNMKMLNVDACDCCTQSVDLVASLLAKGTSVDDIKTASEEKCRTFPSPYDSVCVNFVELYLNDIIGFIEQGMETSELCMYMGFCPPTTKAAAAAAKTKAKAASKRKAVKGIGCGLCTSFVGYVKKYLEEQGVPPPVDAIVSELCANYPSPYDTLCHAIADECLGMVVEWLDQGIDALDICARLGFCQDSKKIKKITQKN